MLHQSRHTDRRRPCTPRKHPPQCQPRPRPRLCRAGQILGGSDPATAARYQIVIMFLISATTAIAAVATIFWAVLSIIDDRYRYLIHPLTA